MKILSPTSLFDMLKFKAENYSAQHQIQLDQKLR